MDNEIVIVTLEYHIMAEDSADAISKVMVCLEPGIRDRQTTPYNIKIETVTASSGVRISM